MLTRNLDLESVSDVVDFIGLVHYTAAVSQLAASVLDRSALFSALGETDRAQLAESARVEEQGEGTRLFLMGDPAVRVYLIDAGQIRLSKFTDQGEEVIVAVLGDGQLFAVVAALEETTYPVTAEVMVPTTLLSWPREAIGPLFARRPELVARAMQMVSARMRELQERYHELATLPVPQRLAKALLRLVDRHGEPGERGLALGVRLSRQDLAEMTGTTLYTVSRILSGWSQEGIVFSGRRRVEILDIAALEAVARPSDNRG